MPLSALSMPPVARIGNPGRALAIADTARRAIGRIALPGEVGFVRVGGGYVKIGEGMLGWGVG